MGVTWDMLNTVILRGARYFSFTASLETAFFGIRTRF